MVPPMLKAFKKIGDFKNSGLGNTGLQLKRELSR